MTLYRFALQSTFRNLRETILSDAPGQSVRLVERHKYRGFNIVLVTLTDGRKVSAAVQAG